MEQFAVNSIGKVRADSDGIHIELEPSFLQSSENKNSAFL